MLAIRNFGEKSLDELLEALEAKGVSGYLEGTEFDPSISRRVRRRCQ